MSEAALPEQLIDQPLPDLSLPDSAECLFPLRQFVGHSPLVLFFFIHNGTPG